MAIVCFLFTVLTCIVSVNTFHHDLIHNLGKFQPRIVHGTIPDHHDLPFMAFVAFRGVDDYSDMGCTGTIIGSRYVLTAFRCVVYAGVLSNFNPKKVRSNMVVSLGSRYRLDGQAFYVAEIHIADDSSRASRSRKTDGIDGVVILELDRPIRFDNITAAPVTLGDYEPRPNERLTIAGFGRHIGGRGLNERSYVIGHATVNRNDGPNDRLFYTKDYNEGPAQNDNGGPALVNVPGEHVQVGINIRQKLAIVPGTGHLEVEGTYAKIGPLCGFIRDVTNGEASCIRLAQN